MELMTCIKDIRKKLGLTQNEIARMIDIDESSMSLYMHGKRNPSIPTMRKIVDLAKANGLQVEYSDFMGDL